MNSNTIQYIYSRKQDTKEGIYTMKGKAFTNLVHNIIREYGTYSCDTYYIDAEHLDDADRKLILSYVLESNFEKDLIYRSPMALKVLFKENLSFIQSTLDNYCDEVYSEDMYEAGLVRNIHSNNGEVYWTRR